MTEKLIGLFIILTILISVFGISYNQVGNMAVKMPVFFVDTFSKLPNGNEITPKGVLNYLVDNLAILTAPGLAVDIGKIVYYRGNLPKASCATELDRLVYFVNGSIRFLTGDNSLVTDYPQIYKIEWNFHLSTGDDPIRFYLEWDDTEFPSGYKNKDQLSYFYLSGFPQKFYCFAEFYPQSSLNGVYISSIFYPTSQSTLRMSYSTGHRQPDFLRFHSTTNPIFRSNEKFYIVLWNSKAGSNDTWITYSDVLESTYNGSDWIYDKYINYDKFLLGIAKDYVLEITNVDPRS